MRVRASCGQAKICGARPVVEMPEAPLAVVGVLLQKAVRSSTSNLVYLSLAFLFSCCLFQRQSLAILSQIVVAAAAVVAGLELTRGSINRYHR